MSRSYFLVVVWYGLGLASCDRTGLVVPRPDAGGSAMDGVNPSTPSSDGCPASTQRCGLGRGARCLSLETDPLNCGACGKTCAIGIACVAGACQHTNCTGTTTFDLLARYERTLALSNWNPPWPYLPSDMNRDGRLDLIETDEQGTIAVWVGQADGGFSINNRYATVGSVPAQPRSEYVATGDFNEDGLMDVAVVGKDKVTAESCLGKPGGGVAMRPGLSFRGPIADVDGDGHLDVIAGPDLANGKAGQYLVQRGRGDGSFFSASKHTVPNDLIAQFVYLDWNGDGVSDLVGLGTTLHILLGRGDGTFGEPERCGVGVDYWNSIFADLNRDGRFDLVWPVSLPERIGAILGQGGCNFSPRRDLVLDSAGYSEGDPFALAVGDLTGDGVPDLLAAGKGKTSPLWAGNGDGSFVPPYPLPLDWFGPMRVFQADVTGDGRLDIVSAGGWGFAVFANRCSP